MFLLAAGDKVNPLGHVLDITLIETANGTPVLTMHMVTLVAAAALLLIAMTSAAASIATGREDQGHERYVAKGRLAQLIEVIVLYLRDNVIEPVLGKDLGRKYLPFLLTVFFFILANNVLGLIPILDVNHIVGGFLVGDPHAAVIGGTPTGNIAVTGALATIAFIVINLHGLRDLGVGGYCHHLLGGAPAYLAPLMVPIEIMGTLIKPAALAIRLFANMLAGHTLMATLALFGTIAVNAAGTWLLGAPVTLVSVAAASAIYFLEIFVAFLQAFIFMFLTTIFIGQLTHHHDHGDQHAHAEAAH